MKIIRYISASERLNYGDLLFPIIFKKYFDEDFEFENYGLIESDNSSFGALKTKSFRKLSREIQNEDIFVVGGGEVFFSKWSKLVSFISPFYNFFYGWKVFKKIDEITNITSYIMGGKGSYSPYIPRFTMNTFYISVGGQFNKFIPPTYKNEIEKCLNNSKSLSVRDSRTFESLRNENVKSKLIPDSAILMSRIYDTNKLKSLTSFDAKDFSFPFIYFQVSVDKGPEDLELFVKNLSKAANKHSLKVLCCPIGLAPGHDDHKILQKMSDLNPNWQYVHPKNIYDIMYLISESKLYVGTSLHGAITAFAYGVPIIPLNKKLKKLDGFIDTWASEVYINCIDFYQIEDALEESLNKWDHSKAKNLLIEQQNIVESYFRELKSDMLK
jgi:polysaccharide pyruvyl transferase WcaK-like protein